MKFYTYENAIKEREKLNRFISLIEKYNVESFEHWVIKQYAINGSISGIIRELRSCPFPLPQFDNNREELKLIILKPHEDDLHKFVQKQYKLKASYRKKK